MKLGEVHYRWIGIPVVALIAELVNEHELENLSHLEMYFFSLVFAAVYWNGAWLVIRYFRKRFPQIHATKKRLTYSAILIVLWMYFGAIRSNGSSGWKHLKNPAGT